MVNATTPSPRHAVQSRTHNFAVQIPSQAEIESDSTVVDGPLPSPSALLSRSLQVRSGRHRWDSSVESPRRGSLPNRSAGLTSTAWTTRLMRPYDDISHVTTSLNHESRMSLMLDRIDALARRVNALRSSDGTASTTSIRSSQISSARAGQSFDTSLELLDRAIEDLECSLRSATRRLHRNYRRSASALSWDEVLGHNTTRRETSDTRIVSDEWDWLGQNEDVHTPCLT